MGEATNNFKYSGPSYWLLAACTDLGCTKLRCQCNKEVILYPVAHCNFLDL